MSRVPVEPFQKRYLELRQRGQTASEMARRAGYLKADTNRLRRRIGLYRQNDNGSLAGTVPEDVALTLCRALDLDPVDVGL